MIEIQTPLGTKPKKPSISSSENIQPPSTPSSYPHHDILSNDTTPSSTNEMIQQPEHTKFQPENGETHSINSIPEVYDPQDGTSTDPITNGRSDKQSGKHINPEPVIRRHTTNDLLHYKLQKTGSNSFFKLKRSSLDNGHPAGTEASTRPSNGGISPRGSIGTLPGAVSSAGSRAKPASRRTTAGSRALGRKLKLIDDDKVLIGNKISEGHENFVMAYNMLTGIRVAVSRCSGVPKKLTDQDFYLCKKLTFNFDGNDMTPSLKYDFKFKDYCPEVFREMRGIFGLDQADYLISITGRYILSELGLPGKSGSFFYYSRDFRFIIKTIHHSEHKQLRRILKDYYNHVKLNPNTLISQIYGLHRVKMPLGNGVKRKVHFIVMNNLFPPHRDIHLKYDLKGSTWGRYTRQGDVDVKPLKDLNWLEDHQQINFGPNKRKVFVDQLEKDVGFLKKINSMDYSLLLGIHDTKRKSTATTAKLSIFDPKSDTKTELMQTNPRYINPNEMPTDVYPGRSKFIFYGHDGGIRSTNKRNEPGADIYYLGIIDFLTNYSLKKRLETFWRSLSHSRDTILSVPAHEYGERFLQFIKKSIPKEKQE